MPATAQTCAGCQSLEQPDTKTVALLSGQTVCSSCPDWQAECKDRHDEALKVLGMAWKDDRIAYLGRVEAQRGAEARKRLEVVIMAQWKARNGADIRATK